MNPRLVLATAARCLRQLAHDKRSIAMIIVVPSVLLFLLYSLFDGAPVFNRIGLVMLGLFPHIIMFLITGISMLRERTTGTLERLLTTPIHRGDLLAGYGLAFGLAAAVQGAVSTAAAYWLFDLQTAGDPIWVVLIAIMNGLLGVGLGLFTSAFARTEFQAVQFMPLTVFPQLLASGVILPRDQMAGWLQTLSDFFPLTYAVEALQQVGAHAEPTATMWADIGIVAGVIVVALALGALTLPRRTA
ncbi:ABC transporter permease [Tessaracoccus sp. SD287]|uniref:ABC transporter permease n=1 Tax=Tessaracoccus sp. SD287 TaxID=2782008 RepID=UPI001A97A0FB|nr:ABC transporter permease [Tessaracoccus sp. SD287]MBO1032386.1 ABC transporter permease [Tessaracoccus sp. SD287]